MSVLRSSVQLLIEVGVVCALGCGTPGVVEVHPVPNSTTAANVADADDDAGAAECPAAFSCMDIAALGYEAVDRQGDPVRASCSTGGITPCDDDDPSSTCEGLTDPICVHLMLGDQEIVSCGQRCTP